MRKLVSYAWPGNVRELANLLERAVALSDHDTLLPEDLDLPAAAPEQPAASPVDMNLSLAAVERAHVDRVLEASGGNKAAAARALGIDRRTLYRHLHEREPHNGMGNGDADTTGSQSPETSLSRRADFGSSGSTT